MRLLSKDSERDFELEDLEFQTPESVSFREPDEFFVHKDYRNRLNKRLTFLDKKGVNSRLLIILLILLTLSSFAFLVVMYSYNVFKNTSTLLTEVNELENAFLEVQLLTRVRNEAIGSMSTRSYFNELQTLIPVGTKPGNYKGVTLSGTSRDILDILEMIINEPRITIEKLELRSNLGFPILPESNLPSNIMIELKTDLSVTGSF